MNIKKEIQRTRDKLSEIRRILVKQAWMFFQLVEATPEQDMNDGFDMSLTVMDLKIPVRIRHHTCKFRDFTIRSKTQYNSKTELDKLIEGAGDFYFYAWTNSSDKISEYMIVELKKVRKSGLLNSVKGEIPNGDGTCFVSISIADLMLNDCLKCYEKIR